MNTCGDCHHIVVEAKITKHTKIVSKIYRCAVRPQKKVSPGTQFCMEFKHREG